MTKLGFFGGAFDPIHNAHLHLAEHAYQSLLLDEVLFMPSGGQPYYKTEHEPASPRHRYEMVKAAVEENPHFKVSEYEVSQEKFCYTIDTLRHLRSVYPPGSEIILLAGEDWREKIPEWKEGDKLLQEFKVAFFSRPVEEENQNRIYKHENVMYVDMPELDISSTEIRERIEAGQSIDDLVPEAVKRYIEARGLYR